MAILTTAGRVALAIALSQRPLHIAWGTGSAGWDTTPVPEPIDATALVAEVGRRTVTQQRWVNPNPAGDIVVPAGVFATDVNPTNHLYLRCDFDYTDAPSALIREFGVFVDTTLQAGLPGGQQYFSGAEVTSPGRLVALQRVPKITRSVSTRQLFEIVLRF